MKKSVLVIDDDKLMLNFLNGLLENEYDVMSADNGKDGMSLLLLHKPDLVILDLVMPYIDGYKFLNILNEKNITPKLILITGVPPDKRDAIDGTNVLEIILKPFTSENFLKVVKKHI
ncbi:MAG: response regulator [Oligoflexales bacterium]|nr:response regulator [Oligoflexales bacterium]